MSVPDFLYQHKLKARCAEVVARVTEVSWAVKFIDGTDSYESITSQAAGKLRIRIRLCLQA